MAFAISFMFIQSLLILFSLCCVQKDSESSLEYYAVRTILRLGTEEPSNQQKQRSTQNPFETALSFKYSALARSRGNDTNDHFCLLSGSEVPLEDRAAGQANDH